MEKMMEKKMIQIVSVPEGPGIPEAIRKGWIGAVLEAVGPMEVDVIVEAAEGSPAAVVVGSTPTRHGYRWVYCVPTDLALAVLKYRNSEAWLWFTNQPELFPTFCFDAGSCKELSRFHE